MEALVIHAPGDLRVEDVRDRRSSATTSCSVRVRCGGICGSDLHYYQHGGFGTVRIKEPMVLGHEVAGVIEAVGAGVAASPSATASRSARAGRAACAAIASKGCRTTAWTCATTAARCARRTCRARSASRSWSSTHQAYKLADDAQRRRRRDGRAAVGGAARGAPRRAAAGQARAGHRLRADRRADRHRRAARRRDAHRRHRRRRASRCARR